MIVAVVVVETTLLVLLIVLVAGLLRSHAEILRRLGPRDDEERPEGVVPPPPASRTIADKRAPELAGATPSGDAVKLAFDRATAAPTLLAFLTTGCSTCAGFWEALGERRLVDVEVVIVTRGSEREQPSKLRALAPAGVPVVMSSRAWEDYRVPGAPYFVLVEGIVRGEGVATTWPALASLVRDALDDQRDGESVSAGTKRAQRIDQVLAAAGIGPDHPSLYPGREGGASAGGEGGALAGGEGGASARGEGGGLARGEGGASVDSERRRG